MAIDTWAGWAGSVTQPRPAPGKRTMRVGRSSEPDTRRAVAQATRQALQGEDPRLMLVFASPDAHGPDVAAAAAEQTRAAGCPDLPTIGCSTAGHIGFDGPAPAQPNPDVGATAVVLGGDVDVATAVTDDLASQPREAGRAIATALTPPEHRAHHLAILLTDLLSAEHPEMIRGAYAEWGATIPIAGAVADPLTPTSWLLHGGRVSTSCLTGVLLSSDAPMTVAVDHGWRGGGPGMLATASSGNVLHELDDRPALDAFLDRLLVPEGADRDEESFINFVLSKPLAIARRGRLAVRQIIAVDLKERTLVCSAVVPRGAQVYVAETSQAATIAAADRVCREAVSGLGGASPTGLLIFDCIGRRMALPPEALPTEWETLRAYAEGAPVAGFYTGGEFARVHGTVGFHNQTIVACALG